jgi:hypothetical protein
MINQLSFNPIETMRKFIPKFTFALVLLATLSCSSKSDKSNVANTQETKGETASFDPECLYAYMSKYDQLLPLESIKNHYSGDMTTAELNYQKSGNPAMDKCLYVWKSDRIRKVDMMGVKMSVPEENEIGVKWLGSDLFMIKGLATPKENFEQFYRNVSQEEANAALAKAEKIAQEKEGLTTEQAQTAVKMGKGLAEGQQFEKVDGVGEAAAWVVKEKHLVVLVGDKTFQLVANVSANNDENKMLAIALAKEVLAKCN